jgi:hypothetical protein
MEKVTFKKPHKYTFSLLANIQWTIKRIVNSSILDVKIRNFLTENFSKKKYALILAVGLGLLMMLCLEENLDL